jgi:hypothetical protein
MMPGTMMRSKILAAVLLAFAMANASGKGGVSFVTTAELGVTTVSIAGGGWYDPGIKAAVGGGPDIPLFEMVSLKPGLDIFYKTYNANNSWGGGYEKFGFKELGLGLSALVRAVVLDAFRPELGFRLEIPFLCFVVWEYDAGGGPSDDWSVYVLDKDRIGAGLAFGIGYLVTDKISVGGKGVVSFSDKWYKVNQYGLALDYSF